MSPPDKDARPPPSGREQQLAEALRANLRRRKAGGRAAAQGPAQPKSSEDD